jgi:hypothetical protein
MAIRHSLHLENLKQLQCLVISDAPTELGYHPDRSGTANAIVIPTEAIARRAIGEVEGSAFSHPAQPELRGPQHRSPLWQRDDKSGAVVFIFLAAHHIQAPMMLLHDSLRHP